MTATICKYLERTANYLKPLYCSKLKTDEPWRYCRKCLFKELKQDDEPEKNKAILENANKKRKKAWEEYAGLVRCNPEIQGKLKAAMAAEEEYAHVAQLLVDLKAI